MVGKYYKVSMVTHTFSDQRVVLVGTIYFQKYCQDDNFYKSEDNWLYTFPTNFFSNSPFSSLDAATISVCTLGKNLKSLCGKNLPYMLEFFSVCSCASFIW